MRKPANGNKPWQPRPALRGAFSSRHLTQAQRRELIGAQLRETPEKSDRQVASGFGVDHKTVSSVRDELNTRGEIPHVEHSTDSLGRKQPRKRTRYVDPTPEGRQGTKRDAILHSVGANTDHGLRRTNPDKRQAVMVLLKDEEWAQWSDREIARRCHVHNSFVSKIRASLSTRDSEKTAPQPATRTYTTKHGTKATMNTENISHDLFLGLRRAELKLGHRHGALVGLCFLDQPSSVLLPQLAVIFALAVAPAIHAGAYLERGPA